MIQPRHYVAGDLPLFPQQLPHEFSLSEPHDGPAQELCEPGCCDGDALEPTIHVALMDDVDLHFEMQLPCELSDRRYRFSPTWRAERQLELPTEVTTEISDGRLISDWHIGAGGAIRLAESLCRDLRRELADELADLPFIRLLLAAETG